MTPDNATTASRSTVQQQSQSAKSSAAAPTDASERFPLDAPPASAANSPNKDSPKHNVASWERQLSLAAGIGLGLLALRHPTKVKNLAMLGVAGALVHRGWSGSCALYNALGISTEKRADADSSAKPAEYSKKGIHVEESVSVYRPAAELYARWRALENLPTFMDHLKEVREIDQKRSHWVAKAPMNTSVEWDAEIINEQQDQLIAWKSVGSADVDNSGSVTFTPSTDGSHTVVKVVLQYIPPAGQLGAWVAQLFGEEPSQQIKQDLRRFKQLSETGEISTNANGNPRGTCSGSSAE